MSADIELKTDSSAVLGIIETHICICIIPTESLDLDTTTLSCP